MNSPDEYDSSEPPLKRKHYKPRGQRGPRSVISVKFSDELAAVIRRFAETEGLGTASHVVRVIVERFFAGDPDLATCRQERMRAYQEVRTWAIRGLQEHFASQTNILQATLDEPR